MSIRPTLATVALGGCEGCHLALLDNHEHLVALLGDVDLVTSPFSGPDRLPEHVDVVMVEGAVQTDEDRHRLFEARKSATTLVAVGSCAVYGGIGGLRNLFEAEDVANAAFGTSEDKAEELPTMAASVLAAADVVAVDYEVPGCSPAPETLLGALASAVAGEPYQPPRRNLCAECHRTKELLLDHSAEFVTESVYALMELDEIDEQRCFLEQGVVCMGAMTREGCGARCTAVNIPCRGCGGPSRREFEQGGKAVDALAAVLPAGALMFMEDLVGTGYRYSMPASLLPALEKGE